MKNILFVIPTLSGGGAERVISVLSDELCKQGYNVGLLLSMRKEDEYYLNPNVRLYVDGTNGSENPIIRSCKRIKKYRNFARDFKPDVVIPFLPSIMRDAYIAKMGIKTCFVGTMRAAPIGLSKLAIKVQDYVFNHSDIIYLQTSEQKKYLSQKAVSKAFVLPNPINAQLLPVQWQNHYGDSIQLITLGRLTKQKNYSLLIDSVAMVHKRFPNVKLNIFGQGPLQEELQKLIDEKNVNNYIKLCGRTNTPVDELLKSDMFVFSSNYEGMPNALMEAMAVGLPCISTDCPTGPKELIGDNERGLLVPVEDASAMAKAIINMIENPIEAVEMGKKAKTYIVNNFSPEIITKKLIENLRKTNKA